MDRTPQQVDHPAFGRIYDRFARFVEQRGVGENRRRLLEGLTGDVIEIGAGNGLSFAHYPPTVTHVLAVEPEPYLRRRAEQLALTARVPVTVVDGTAERLPGEDHRFDAAVFSLVLCSVTDQRAALAEARRVLKTTGEVRFYEHVRANSAKGAALQDRLDPLWSRVAGGCHLSRDTTQAISEAGFTLDQVDHVDFGPAPIRSLAPHVIGTATIPTNGAPPSGAPSEGMS